MKKTSTKLSAKFTFTLLLLCGACFASPVAFAKPYTKVFPASYDSVWKSALIAVTQYPLEKNDKSSGEIKTSKIEAGQVYKTYKGKSRRNELYTINISLEKKRLQGKKVVLVKVEKMPMIKGNFMREAQYFESDGIEENVLLYRIAREVSIDRVVEKLFK